jgi:shikimate kinase
VQPERHIKNLALIGFMGVGKSTVGHFLAANLHYEFLDTDHLIETRAGRSIPEIFETAGEAAFRQLERQVILELAQKENTIIATGGGLPCFDDNINQLKAHALLVCLWASPETIWERVRHSSHRPLLQTPDPLGRIRELLAQRESFYRQADLLISTDLRPSREIAQFILHEFYAVRNPKAGS